MTSTDDDGQAPRGPSILIADDHVPIRAGVRAIIEELELGSVIAQVGRGDEAMECIRELAPDIALVDQRMPGLTGTQLATKVREEGLPTRVVVLSAYTNASVVRAAIAAGAAGYIGKDSGEDSFAVVLRQVHERGIAIDPVLIADVLADNQDDELSPRQLDVLQRMATGQMNDAIALGMGISAETVKSHVSSILRKFGASSRTEAVAMALRRALIE